jgi:hypothetical protein
MWFSRRTWIKKRWKYVDLAEDSAITKIFKMIQTHQISQLKKLIQNMDAATKEVLKKYETEIETLQQQV